MVNLFDRGAVFAFLLCFSALTIQIHGLGAGSTASAILLLGSIIALGSVGRWSTLTPDLCDTVFVLFAATVCASIVKSGFHDLKEGALLFLSLCIYPAARCATAPLRTTGFVVVMAVVTALGSVETFVALVDQWNHPHGKPIVLGYDAAATIVSMVAGLLILAVASFALSIRQTVLAGAALSLPVMIAAASMVRLTLALIIVALACMAAFGGKAIRPRALILIGFVAASMLIGLAARPKMTSIYLQHAISSTTGSSSAHVDTSTCPTIDMDNSIAIRLSLYRDAFKLLGESGWFGIGLEQIPVRSCTKNFEVHNSIIQVLVELGPISAILLLMLIILPLRSLISIAPISNEAAFALGGLVFVVLISLAHGRISRDIHLFAFLGYAASIRTQTFEIAKVWMLRNVPV